jgi:2-polyprenyl-3-methyl-5-hydroxy-6-metoxy-1,4-benzoquinol methylase
MSAERPDLGELWSVWQQCLAEQKAEPYTEHHAQAARDLLDLWLPLCGDAGLFLDVGCGTGWLKEHVNKLGWQYVGMGLQQEADIRDDMHFSALDAAHQVVFCRHMVEHSPMPLLAVTKLYQFTAPGGYCIVVTPTPPFYADWPQHFSVMPRAAWAGLFKRAGFAIEQSCTKEIGDSSVESRFLLRRPE